MLGAGLIVCTGEVVVAGKLCARVSESIWRTRDEKVSRLSLGNGELLWRTAGDTLLDVGVVCRVATGIDELRLLLSDESLRSDCADSGRFRLAAMSRRDTELGPVVERELFELAPAMRLPVLLLRLRLDAGPDGLFRGPVGVVGLRPVGGLGAR